MEVISLYEGSYSVDSSKEFIPFNPAHDKKSDRPGSLFIHVHPFLIQTKKGLLVLDTGLGFKKDGELLLRKNIREAGFEPQDVAFVLMSHLHQDHASGMIYEQNGHYELTFPNASYVIQRQEWTHALTSDSESYRANHLDFLQKSGNLRLVDGNGSIDEFIHYELSGGHCEFHQVFRIEDAGNVYFYGGDEWPEPEQVLRRFAAKYDYDGRKAMHLREVYAQRAAEEDWICLFYHATGDAVTKIESNGDSFKILAY